MRVTVTVGSGNCNHIHFVNGDTNQTVAVTRGDLTEYDREDYPRWFSRVVEFVRRYRRTNPSATWAQIRTAVQAEDF